MVDMGSSTGKRTLTLQEDNPSVRVGNYLWRRSWLYSPLTYPGQVSTNKPRKLREILNRNSDDINFLENNFFSRVDSPKKFFGAILERIVSRGTITFRQPPRNPSGHPLMDYHVEFHLTAEGLVYGSAVMKLTKTGPPTRLDEALSACNTWLDELVDKSLAPTYDYSVRLSVESGVLFERAVVAFGTGFSNRSGKAGYASLSDIASRVNPLLQTKPPLKASYLNSNL